MTRDGAAARMFDAASGEADLRDFAERTMDDRHDFRFIVSPEDAAEMEDLRAFTRDLVKQMEHDLGTRLDWVALDHWNTDKSAHLISSSAALTITATPSSSIATTSVTHTRDLFPRVIRLS